MTAILCILGVLTAGFGATEKREAALEELLDMMPPSAEFSAWLEAQGELPPDFDALPSHAPQQHPLRPVVNGEEILIDTPEAWRAERRRLLDDLQQWILGSVPPAPENLIAETLDERDEDGVRVREVELRFGPGHKAKLWMQVYIPPGPGPFPVFMTQENHRAWAQIALRRGYIACVYAGADSRDDTDTFLEAWPDYDWSRLMRRGWAAGRCLDYLAEMPEADITQSALTGHSRNGKSSLMGAAMDERIAVVISSSSGVGGAVSSRYCGEHHFKEGIEHITRRFPDWFHPRWRFFVGREHKAPVDLHHLTALAAPRACLLSIALNDNVEHTWAVQHTYLSAKPVYELYDASDKLRILWRPGGHETWPEVIERYMDWCDLQFGRGDYAFPEEFVYPWDWQGWRAKAIVPFTPDALPDRPFGDDAARPEDLGAVVRRMLGDMPPVATAENMTYGVFRGHVLSLLRRESAGSGLEREQLSFGNYINGDIYAPAGTQERGEPIPAILYLPSFSTPGGYVPAYRRGEHPYHTLARAGFAVFCFDPIGTGRRVDETARFYDRRPNWSLLGKMVQDAQAALDALTQVAYIDPERVWVVGYELGAFAAMHLSALDDRPAGYGLVCPPLPLRLDTDELETGGLRRWSHELMLLPQLGDFAGRETRIPYDLDELLGAMAPRPLVLVTPSRDRFAPPALADAMEEVVRARYEAYAAGDKLVRVSPMKYNHFDNTMQQALLEAMLPLTKQ